MLTVPQVIEKVYGIAARCAEQLGVKPSAVSNWKSAGEFPARIVPSILLHAKERSIELDVEDVPASEQGARKPVPETNGAAA